MSVFKQIPEKVGVVWGVAHSEDTSGTQTIGRYLPAALFWKILIHTGGLSPGAFPHVFGWFGFWVPAVILMLCLLACCSIFSHQTTQCVRRGGTTLLKGKEVYRSYTCAAVKDFTSRPKPTALRRCGIWQGNNSQPSTVAHMELRTENLWRLGRRVGDHSRLSSFIWSSSEESQINTLWYRFFPQGQSPCDTKASAWRSTRPWGERGR